MGVFAPRSCFLTGPSDRDHAQRGSCDEGNVVKIKQALELEAIPSAGNGIDSLETGYACIDTLGDVLVMEYSLVVIIHRVVMQ